MGYVFQEYPKWVQKDGVPVLVNSAEEEAALLPPEPVKEAPAKAKKKE